ncbi:unnamed protein product [Rotaria socialis]|uniref:Uncharacterized protein n=1 Tax=Rotaria socialis TaxID=392032 RepID=A0A819AJ64_9BILA|nr:unnamed protein product [Rotaria socialis]CAF3778419.1 unnamed protein product [Rotaria socialis]CAF4716502.1 unnamed protein product [Rotaria socialis]CAF4889665.1 unnamed protein product [Rotaria socialis]
MATRGNTSHTMTTQVVQKRCRDLVLKLTDPTNRSATSEARAIVNSARKYVDARFHELVERNVMDKNKNVNPKLVDALETSDDPEHFLKTFIVSLYGKAVEIEEAIAVKSLNDEEKRRLRRMHDNDKDCGHDDDIQRRNPSGYDNYQNDGGAQRRNPLEHDNLRHDDGAQRQNPREHDNLRPDDGAQKQNPLEHDNLRPDDSAQSHNPTWYKERR